MQTHGGLAAPKAVYTGWHENYKSREMQNIYYLLEILQNGGGIQGLWSRPDTLEIYKLWWKDLVRCPLQEVWWPIPLNRHWCYWWSVVRNVWTFGLPTDCSWIPFIEDEDATLNHGYGVTTCRTGYHPTLCVSFRDADGIVSQSRNSRLYWILVTFNKSSGWCRSPNLGSQQPGNHTDVTVCQNVYKHQSVLVASPTRVSISFSFRWFV